MGPAAAGSSTGHRPESSTGHHPESSTGHRQKVNWISPAQSLIHPPLDAVSCQ